MKWMQKLRLINWHYFTDETMEFGKQTLITGKNAAGKSTIIDAMQVLFVADHRQIRFNPAAHDEAKRSMINYLKGKIGNDDRTYLRDGDFTSYIIAEFRDTSTKTPFVVGVVIDIFRDQSYDDEYFILADLQIEDLNLVKPSGHLRSREEFRRFYSGSGGRNQSVFERNKSNYQKALLNRMGQIHERFFSIFTKALSFKPIHNVRDFVYDYILDKRELQLDLLKQNFEIHERYKQELEEMQKRKDKLQIIRDQFNQYIRLRETVKEQDYVIRKLRLVREQEIQQEQQQALLVLDNQLTVLNENMSLAAQKQEEARTQSEEAYKSWQSHAAERRKKELEEEIQRLENEQRYYRSQLKLFANQLNNEHEMLESLLHWPGNDMWQWSEGELAKLERIAETLAHLVDVVENERTLGPFERDLQETFHEAGAMLSTLYQRMLILAARAKDRLGELDEQISGLNQTIRDLENRKRTYPESVQRLKDLLEERLEGRSSVRIFCEEMEVEDESWRNAIEGYLNTQKYDLLVEPFVFAEALSVYEQDKWTYKLEGVGLVDTEREQRYLGTAEPNSLVEALRVEDPVIRAHMEHLLGKVIKVENEQELRNFRTAVTRSCMVYNNLVARQIPKRQYEVPFIGTKAILRQLEIKREELEEALRERESLIAIQQQLNFWTQTVSEKQSLYQRFSEQLQLPTQFEACRSTLELKRSELDALDLSEAEQLKAQYQQWRDAEKEWSDKRLSLTEQKAKLETERNYKSTEIYLQKNKVQEAQAYLDSWSRENDLETGQRAVIRWRDAEKQDIPTVKKIENWESNRKGNESRSDQEFQKIQLLRQRFNIDYSFNGLIDSTENAEYEELLDEIENLNIPDYQQKVEAALRDSEEEFKSHFIFKLREAIQIARREFDQLNYALRHFPFSEDKYHFEVSASEKYKKFHDAVMDPMLMEQGSLFDMADNDKTESLHELFDLLVRGEAGDLDEFTDYRRYLDFDMIVSTLDSRYRFSQVLKEKSGGETQTPFYIAILASFHHLYANDKTMRLVVFDEAFNKMDEQRIQTSLRLIKQMNLQLVAAVPDEKMQHMAPEVSTTLIVSKHDYHCFVDMIDRWEGDEEEDGELSVKTTQPVDRGVEQGTLF